MHSKVTAYGQLIVDVAINTAANSVTWSAVDDRGRVVATGPRDSMLCTEAGTVVGFTSVLGEFPINQHVTVWPGNTVHLGEITVAVTCD